MDDEISRLTDFPFLPSPLLRGSPFRQPEPLPTADRIVFVRFPGRRACVSQIDGETNLGLDPGFRSAFREAWEHDGEDGRS